VSDGSFLPNLLLSFIQMFSVIVSVTDKRCVTNWLLLFHSNFPQNHIQPVFATVFQCVSPLSHVIGSNHVRISFLISVGMLMSAIMTLLSNNSEQFYIYVVFFIHRFN